MGRFEGDRSLYLCQELKIGLFILIARSIWFGRYNFIYFQTFYLFFLFILHSAYKTIYFVLFFKHKYIRFVDAHSKTIGFGVRTQVNWITASALGSNNQVGVQEMFTQIHAKYRPNERNEQKRDEEKRTIERKKKYGQIERDWEKYKKFFEMVDKM